MLSFLKLYVRGGKAGRLLSPRLIPPPLDKGLIPADPRVESNRAEVSSDGIVGKDCIDRALLMIVIDPELDAAGEEAREVEAESLLARLCPGGN